MQELHCDILIAGSGLGGTAAALAAAETGAHVILTGETGWLGGQATEQGVPLDEHPWIEQFGCNASYRRFRDGVRAHYRRNYPLSYAAQKDRTLNPGAAWVSGLSFEPRAGRAVLEEMLAPLRSAGLLRFLPGLKPAAVECRGDRIEAVLFRESRGERELLISARQIIDATELGDLLPLARVEYVTGAESIHETGEPSAPETADPLKQQGFTHLAAVDYIPGGNFVIEKPANYAKFRPRFESLCAFGCGMTSLFAPGMLDESGEMVRLPEYKKCIWNFRRVLCRGNFRPGVFPSDITMLMNGNECRGVPLVGIGEEARRRALAEARELTLSLIYFLQTELENAQGGCGFPGIRLRGDVFGTSDGLAPYPYIREARRIRAEFTVKEQHFRRDWPGNEKGPVKFFDSIGVGGYRIDVHEPPKSSHNGATNVTDALTGTSHLQQIPLGSLIPVRMENLLAGCKNIGSTHLTNGCFRLHCTEWNIGEAAGALAAFALARKNSPRAVRNTPELLADFQRLLIRRGVELDWTIPSCGQSYAGYHSGIPDWYWGEARP